MFKNRELHYETREYLKEVLEVNDYFNGLLEGIEPSQPLKERGKVNNIDALGNSSMEYQNDISDFTFTENDVHFMPKEYLDKLIILLKDLPLYPPPPHNDAPPTETHYHERVLCYFFPNVMAEYIEMTIQTGFEKTSGAGCFEDFGFLVPFGTLFNSALEVINLSPKQLAEKYGHKTDEIIFHLSAILQAFNAINNGILEPKTIINLMSDTNWNEPSRYYGLNPGHFSRINQAALQSPHYSSDKFHVNSVGIIFLRSLFALDSFKIKHFNKCFLCGKYFVPLRENNIYCLHGNPEYPDDTCVEAADKIRAKDHKKCDTLYNRIYRRLYPFDGDYNFDELNAFLGDYTDYRKTVPDDVYKYSKYYKWLLNADSKYIKGERR